MLVRVKADGTRIVQVPPPKVHTFADSHASAVAAMNALKLTPEVLLRMQRRIARGERYNRWGA